MQPRIEAVVLTALAALAIANSCGADDPAPPHADPEETHALMASLLESLQVLAPLAASDGRLGDASHRGEVRAAAAALARDGAALSRHAKSLGGGAVYLGRSLDRGAAEIQQNIERQRYSRAAYLIQRMTENCVGCHARLPSERDSPRAEAFVARQTLLGMPLKDRATLQIATRRFDDALTSLEELLASRGTNAALLLGPLEDYLTISLRVKNDFVRPVPVLRRFSQREDVWPRLRAQLDVWIAALPELQKRMPDPPDLATARAFVAEGRRLEERDGDHSGLVHDIASSAVLHRYLEREPESQRDVAEAYYLLGLVEARIERDYWVSPADYYLEASIRLGPGEPFARDAYARLEEQLLLSYEGTSVEALPRAESRRLKELSKLLDSAS